MRYMVSNNTMIQSFYVGIFALGASYVLLPGETFFLALSEENILELTLDLGLPAEILPTLGLVFVVFSMFSLLVKK